MSLDNDEPTDDETEFTDNSGQDHDSDAPASIEEYAIRGTLGRGGFGVVLLAYDNTLQREVALKIPHKRLLEKTGSIALYISEARAIASLDHAHIIPVYRAASTPDIPCYIVTKLIRGCHLGQWHRRHHPSHQQLAEVVAKVATALAYAHKHGVVHRDIKPSNILVDDNDHPFVADFGLALRDVDPQGGPAYAGTPPYMSPEQARGEGHRLDGRSDIFSMGVLLYELLTGMRPFKATADRSLQGEIQYSDPLSPTAVDMSVPVELARICMKCLSKHAADRYQNAEHLAVDLRRFANGAQNSSSVSATAAQPTQQARVVPKGLRSFDTQDADFFTRLVPGPLDRDGVPETIRFWISRLSPSHSEERLSVGIIYGPSGCGKTSLVRAGLIPRLPHDVTTVYLQASADKTELDLANEIGSLLGSDIFEVHQAEALDEMFAKVRRRQNGRTVIFLDQFEQWLFAHPDCTRELLTRALRQCDGVYLQCVLLVRDDFWMGVSRLMQALDIRVAEDVNVTTVDLFDPRHARTVLQLFGHAYGRLPELPEQLSPAQSQFLDAAVDYLSTDGRVICVQLALLTEMLKNRPWDKPSEIFNDGGSGMGMRFFEDTFGSESASRRTRMHAEGALRVLRELLPVQGSRIKGSLRTLDELFVASGYRDKDSFNQLIGILDRELHVITPTDQGEDDSLSTGSSVSEPLNTGYQLTHDFLILPIRQWIEFQNRTSPEGKARVRLDEFTKLYQARPKVQSLPTMAEYLGIRRQLSPRTFTTDQQTMMSAARSRHLRTISIWAASLAVFAVFALLAANQMQQVRTREANQADVNRLLVAKMADAIELSVPLRDSERGLSAATTIVQDAQQSHERRVRAALVAYQYPMAADLLTEFVLHGNLRDVVDLATTSPESVAVVLPAAKKIWQQQSGHPDQLLRAACVLANHDAEVPELRQADNLVRLRGLLIAENPAWINDWARGFAVLSQPLNQSLVDFLMVADRQTASTNAVNLLAALEINDPQLLVMTLPSAFPEEVILLKGILAKSQGAADLVRRQWDELSAEASGARAEVTKPWGAPWWCVGDRQPLPFLADLPALTPETQARLIEAESIVAAYAIMVHRLPLDDLSSVTTEVQSAGYRIAEISPYGSEEARFVAALFLRDGATSDYKLDLHAQQLREENQKQLAAGRFPDSFTVYRRHDDPTTRYASVWVAAPAQSGVLEADMYVEVHQDKHGELGWGPLGERGVSVPRVNAVMEQSDGFQYHTSIRWRTRQEIGYSDSWDVAWERVDARRKNDRAAIELQARVSPQLTDLGSAGADAIWWQNLPVDSACLEYQPRREHLRRTQEHFEQGFYPVSLNVASLGTDPTPLFGSTWWRSKREIAQSVELGNRMRNLALTLFHLGVPEFVVDAMGDRDKHELRGSLISACHEFDVQPTWLVDRALDEDANETLRVSCAMALSLYPPESIATPVLQRVAAALPQLHGQTESPCLRSVSETLAFRWRLKLDPSSTADSARELSTVAGDRLIVIQPKNPVWMGAARGEPGRDSFLDPEVPVNLRGPFAIATREVTIDQYRKFVPKFTCPVEYAPTGDCPVMNISWFEAAKYCRWLSEQEGIPEDQMCYPKIDEIGPGMTLENDYLQRIGYRMPTEAEWEFACQGGVQQRRWFGFDSKRLNQHAWTTANSNYVLNPVGRLLPNDFGLFDMLGNSMEFTSTIFRQFPADLSTPELDDGSAGATIQAETMMVNRGGAFIYQPLDARTSQRNRHMAETPRVYLSFRIARTVRVQAD